MPKTTTKKSVEINFTWAELTDFVKTRAMPILQNELGGQINMNNVVIAIMPAPAEKPGEIGITVVYKDNAGSE